MTIFAVPVGTLPNISTSYVNRLRKEDRHPGVYIVKQVWSPDTWRHPMVRFVLATDRNDTRVSVFSILEVMEL